MSGQLVEVRLGPLLGLRSPLLESAGVCHLFTTRVGGVSRAPYNWLNLGYSTGDEPTAIRNNLTRVAEALGFTSHQLRCISQIHGATLLRADHPGAWARPLDPTTWPDADGVIAPGAGLLVGVRVADCLPVLFSSPTGHVVAAVHAGWRGLAAGILSQSATRVAEAAGCQPSDLLVALGPAISQERYEVGPEVHGCFEPEFSSPGAGDRRWLDLEAVAAHQLAAGGVSAVDRASRCVAAEPDIFYSHRRDAGVTGRQGAFIAASA